MWNLFLRSTKSAKRVLRAWCIRGAHAGIINNGLLHKNVIRRRTVHLSSCIIILIIAKRCVVSFSWLLALLFQLAALVMASSSSRVYLRFLTVSCMWCNSRRFVFSTNTTQRRPYTYVCSIYNHTHVSLLFLSASGRITHFYTIH